MSKVEQTKVAAKTATARPSRTRAEVARPGEGWAQGLPGTVTVPAGAVWALFPVGARGQACLAVKAGDQWLLRAISAEEDWNKKTLSEIADWLAAVPVGSAAKAVAVKVSAYQRRHTDGKAVVEAVATMKDMVAAALAAAPRREARVNDPGFRGIRSAFFVAKATGAERIVAARKTYLEREALEGAEAGK